MRLAAHWKVVKFNNYNGEEVYRGNRSQLNKLMNTYWTKVEEYMMAWGHPAFKRQQYKVFNELVYLTIGTGVQAIGLERIVDRTGASPATVKRTIKKAQELGLFVVGYLKDGHKGKYVLVFRLHANFQRIMKILFDEEVSVDNLLPDPSTDPSIELSSNQENPCGSKAEGSKKVSTLSTCSTLKETYEEEDTTLSQAQLIIAEEILENPDIKEAYKEVAHEIVKEIDLEFDPDKLEAIKRIMNNQMQRVEPKYNAKTYVLTMFQNEVQLIKEKNAVEAKLKQNPGFTFYNWVNPGSEQPGQQNYSYGQGTGLPQSQKEPGFIFYDWVNK
jgi:hypothetical protein